MSTRVLLGESGLPRSSAFEKFIFGIGDIGALFSWTFMSIYIMMYYTNSVGIAAATAGTIMLIARFADGISDIIFAGLMKRARFKLGKVRPWFIIAGPLNGLSVILAFNVPASLSGNAKVAYVFITYTFACAIAYTIFQLCSTAIIPLMSYDAKDQARISSTIYIFIYCGVLIIQIATPMMLAAGGGVENASAWRMISIIYGILCCVLLILMGVFIKEKTPPEGYEDTAEKTASVSFGQCLKLLFSDKWTWTLLLLNICFYLLTGITQAVATYTAMYFCGDLSYMTYSTYVTTVIQVVILFVLPILFAKFGRGRMMALGFLIYIVTAIICFSIYKGAGPGNVSIPMAMFSAGISVIGTAVISGGIYLYIVDQTEAMVRKHQIQMAETVSMTSSIGIKIGTGFGVALGGWLLSAFGFDAAAATQSAATLNGMLIMNYIIPAALAIPCVIFAIIWPYSKRQKAVEA